MIFILVGGIKHMLSKISKNIRKYISWAIDVFHMAMIMRPSNWPEKEDSKPPPQETHAKLSPNFCLYEFVYTNDKKGQPQVGIIIGIDTPIRTSFIEFPVYEVLINGDKKTIKEYALERIDENT